LPVLPSSIKQPSPDEPVARQLLVTLDTEVRSKVSDEQVYGNTHNNANMEQPLAYLKALYDYHDTAKRICEIGFAGGHSATIFLHALPNAEYHAFDDWDRPYYEDAALAL
jgi:predicted O-methyltransferase YrrM